MNKAIARLAHGGHLSAVIEKMRGDFLPRAPLVEGRLFPDEAGKYTFLASYLYAQVMAITRSLEFGERPVVARFSFNEQWHQDSELFAAGGPCQKPNYFRALKLTYDELVQLAAEDPHRPMGAISSGVVIKKIHHRALVRIEIGEPSQDSSPNLHRILAQPATRERTVELWQYLAQFSLIDGYDGVARRLLWQFDRTKTVYGSNQFRSQFVSGKL